MSRFSSLDFRLRSSGFRLQSSDSQPSHNLHCIHRANLPADIAFYTFLHINGMDFVRFEFNGIRRAALGTFGAADTLIRYFISDKWQAFS